jgi:hypothetical protein
VLSEATLFSDTQRRVDDSMREYDLFLFDLGISGHWGAPFCSELPVGFGLGFFGEWFAARGEARDPRVSTRLLAKAAANARVAHVVGPVALWGGLQVGYRLTDPRLGNPIAAGLPRGVFVLELGVLALAEGSR